VGAAGGIGNALVRELHARGKPVRAVSRTAPDVPAGVEPVVADVATEAAAAQACAGAAVVYHCAQPAYTRWASDFPGLTAAVLRGAAAAGARLVVADNLYMYGPIEGPIAESSPQQPSAKKGQVRKAMADQLLEAHAAGVTPVAIGRASDYYGPRGPKSAAGDIVFKPAVAGARARWLGSLDQPHTLHFLGDVARGLVVLGEHDRAAGRAWHLPAAPPVTGREFAALVYAELGRRPEVARLAPWMTRIAGLWSPVVRELNETMYQWCHPFVVDSSAFEHELGPAAVTPHVEAVALTVAWYRLASAG